MSNHPLRVLVVDDEQNIADTLAQIFRMEGYESFAAYNGTAALEAAATFVPDVLIADVVMPGMTGWEVAKRYAVLLPSCRVILFSGHADITAVEEKIGSLAARCDVYTKPVSPRVFLDRLRAEAELLV